MKGLRAHTIRRGLKICICLALAVSAGLLLAGCEKEEPAPKTKPVPRSPSQYALTYTTEGNGTIEGPSSQILSPGVKGSAVTAVPAEGHHFVGWSDGKTTPRRIDSNLTSDFSVTARFAINGYVLTYAAEDHGSIEGAAQQTVNHGGEGSTVTAVPAEGYRFVSWSDGVATASRTDADVTSDLAVTAAFAPNQRSLTYVAEGKGRIEGATSQIVEHGGSGSPVTAVPEKNHHFVSWSDGVTTPKRTDSNLKSDLTVTAKFAIDQYTLTYSAGEHGTIDGAGSQKVDHGDSGSKVTAVPAVGYHFVSWSDGVTTASRTDAQVTGDLTVTATFDVNRYTLTYKAGGHGSIEGPNPQTVAHGGIGGAVTAVPEKGYHFERWSDGVDTAQRIDSKVTGDLTVSAAFAINTYTVGGTVSGLVEGTQVVLQNNAGDDLILSADGDFRFAAELLNASPYEVTVLTQPTSPNQVCTVDNGAGTIPEADVADVVVTCVLKTYSIGGTVSGLPEGDRVVLQNNDGDDLTVKADGAFSFATLLDDGSTYQVKVAEPPKKPNWTCEVENGAATLAGQDIGDVLVDCFPKVVLEATAGIRKIELDWNRHDFKQVTFNLCRAQEEFPEEGFSRCEELRKGVLEKGMSGPYVVSGLTNDVAYWFRMEASYPDGRRTLSEQVKATPFGGLNDSGIDWCADSISNHRTDGTRSDKEKSCSALAVGFPGQDGLHGRDATARGRKLDKTGNGAAGFDFTKLCRSGEAAGEKKCAPNPLPGTDYDDWACTHDNITGLTWEIKSDQGLRSKDKTYFWYVPDDMSNGGDPGQLNAGEREEDRFDTHAYIQAVNDMMLCGYNDWRLPTRRELLSIIDNGRINPAVDIRYFPNSQPDNYWTSTPYQDQKASAWQINFLYGEANPGMKTERQPVRLVRGKTITFGLNNP